MNNSSYLIVPDVNSFDSGYGHIIRCIYIALDIGGDILLDIEQQQITKHLINQFAKQYPTNFKNIHIIHEPREHYTGVILDKKEVDKDYILNFLQYGPVLGIDSGGNGREGIPYLIDTLPNTLAHRPNYYANNLLVHSNINPKKQYASTCRQILYYTDDSLLENKIWLCSKLLANPHVYLTIIVSTPKKFIPLQNTYSNFTVLNFDINIIKNISKYDLFISHFGIMAYEAIASKVPVVLLNKTKYHNYLSTYAKFPKIFFHSNDNRTYKTMHSNTAIAVYTNLVKYISNLVNDKIKYATLIEETKKILNYPSITNHKLNIPCLSQIIKNILLAYNNSQIHSTNLVINPWLGLTQEKVIFRNKIKTIYKCQDTKQFHQISFKENFPVYNNNYFSKEYTQQYGRTYLEDYHNILNRMYTRMKTIQNILPNKFHSMPHDSTDILDKKPPQPPAEKNKSKILDLGCAYGAMLQASYEYGYIPLGIEINNSAVHYCNNTLQLNAISGNLINTSLVQLLKKFKSDTSHITVITAFYLIEHLPNIQKLFNEIHQILPYDGLFVCSVPNGAGISSRKNKNAFFELSPIDHFSIFTPRGLSKILNKSGFKISKICITGHHPERFQLPSFMNKLLVLLSKLFKLGDTFEIYAKKQW